MRALTQVLVVESGSGMKALTQVLVVESGSGMRALTQVLVVESGSGMRALTQVLVVESSSGMASGHRLNRSTIVKKYFIPSDSLRGPTRSTWRLPN